LRVGRVLERLYTPKDCVDEPFHAVCSDLLGDLYELMHHSAPWGPAIERLVGTYA
jgi:hypothetical protein